MSEPGTPDAGTGSPRDDGSTDVGELLRERREMTWRERIWGPDRYGVLLVLLLTLIIMTAVVGDDRYGQVIVVLLMGATLAFALKTSQASRRLSLLVVLGASALLALAFAASLADFDQLRELSAAISFLLIFAMILAIARRLATHLRVSWSMLAGALCAYILVGLLFSSAYSFMSAGEGGSIFAQVSQVSGVDTMYFSFITLTTVGYGDLTPVENLPRMIAVTEALIGQIYLVTAVGLLVGNMGRERRARTTPAD